MEFANNYAGPNHGLRLWPHDGSATRELSVFVKSSNMKLEMSKLDKYTCAFWKNMMTGFSNQDKINCLAIALIEYEAIVTRNTNGSDYLSG